MNYLQLGYSVMVKSLM